MSGTLTLQIKIEWSCEPADSVTWKWRTLSQIPGLPRKTKHHGEVARPEVAEEYLKYAAAIDIHSHYYCNESAGLEEFWLMRRQLGGILGFCFTNAYLAIKYFGKKQAATLPVQGNSFNSVYAVWICKPA